MRGKTTLRTLIVGRVIELETSLVPMIVFMDGHKLKAKPFVGGNSIDQLKRRLHGGNLRAPLSNLPLSDGTKSTGGGCKVPDPIGVDTHDSCAGGINSREISSHDDDAGLLADRFKHFLVCRAGPIGKVRSMAGNNAVRCHCHDQNDLH